jgi:hypothetical protein
MFKKTLLALAVAATSTTALAAADIKTNTVNRVISSEGSASLTKVEANVVEVVLGAEYAVGDILTFTFSGADLDVSGSTLPVSVTPVLKDTNDTMTLGLLSSTATTLTYRVTELTYDGLTDETTVGAKVTFAAGDLLFTASSVLASGAATVVYAAETSTGIDIDQSATKGTASIFSVASQFSGSVTSDLDAVIDVNVQRLAFEGSSVVDTITLTPKNTTATTGTPSITYDYQATPTKYTYTIDGDFAFLDTDADKDGVQTTKVTTSVGSVKSITSSAITVEHTATAPVTISIDVSGKTATKADAALATQTFTADIDVAYTDHGTDSDPSTVTGSKAGAKNLANNAAAGEWTLNGANVTIPYIPFGDDVAVIMRATNTGTQTGDLTVRYMLEGVDTEWQEISVSVADLAPGVTNIRDAVMDAIESDAGTSKGKVAIDLTVNAPSNDITVYAAYKVLSEKDRGFVGTFGAEGSVK